MKAWFGLLKSGFVKWQSRSAAERTLFVEALFRLGIARLWLQFLPFKRIAATLGSCNAAESLFAASDMRRAEQIGWAVQAAARRTPWQSACLAQAITAQKMLHRRGIGGTIYLGVARDPTNPAKLKAHAWVSCAKTILTGKAGHQQFTVVSTFSWPGFAKKSH